MDKTTKSYHKLIAWQKLRDLSILTYRFIKSIPKSEEFGLKSQMRRAVVSVLSNFVEAQGEICLILNYWDIKKYQDFDKARSLAG